LSTLSDLELFYCRSVGKGEFIGMKIYQGIDIVEKSRIKKVYKKFGLRFLKKILSNNEISFFKDLKKSDERIIAEFQKIAQGKIPEKRIFKFISEEIFSSINLDDFYSNIDLRVWNRLSFAKTFMYDSQFSEWMKNETDLSEKTRRNYVGAVYKITNEILKMKPEYSSVDELVNNEDLNKLKEDWLSVPENKELDVRGKSMYSAGFNKLISFFESKN